jgi:hypothetical protein
VAGNRRGVASAGSVLSNPTVMIRRDIPKKTKQIGVRFSEEEKLVVEAFVQNHTQAISVSEWIRDLVFHEIQRQAQNGTPVPTDSAREMNTNRSLD